MFLIIISLIVILFSFVFDKVMHILVMERKVSVDTYTRATQLVDLFAFLLVSILIVMAVFAPL